MGFGNLALTLTAILIIQRRSFSAMDAAYWVVVAALLAARYVDITRFAGRTLEGEPAMMMHFRRYALRLLLIAAALWAGVHGFARLV
jgi:hypothetical protein